MLLKIQSTRTLRILQKDTPEGVLKQLRKNLTAQKKVAETVRTQLTYEKNRGAFGEIEISDLELAIADLNHQIEELDKPGSNS